MDQWLQKAHHSSSFDPTTLPKARAIIAPHAGFRYCGHIMAYAFTLIPIATTKRIFLLGPSHHHYTKQCLLSEASSYTTPLGDLPIDTEIYTRLKATAAFGTMNAQVDEAEHSLELLTPYIAHLMHDTDCTLVPIMVGALSFEAEAMYGEILAPYLLDDSNVFVISSDFCHWGKRFGYTYTNDSLLEGNVPIHRSIEWLDKKGMDIIESGDPAAFRDYLQEYRNTICGRHPVGVLLQALKAASCGSGSDSTSIEHRIKFTKYDQSHKCKNIHDSSVSYAAAVVMKK
jgi:MEMO1 family protein